MMVLTALLRYRELHTAARRRGGSRIGKAPNKDRHPLVGALLLDSTIRRTQQIAPKNFGGTFGLTKELFMRIVFDVREYDDNFMYKIDCTRL
jgi:hypothetical protein